MTISYTADIATCRYMGNFYKLLFRWKGSIYKVIWVELLAYTICFFLLNVFYRIYLIHDCDRKGAFLDLVKYCNNYADAIPVSFVLGFYVSIVVDRWWKQFYGMPWTDNLAIAIGSLVEGSDPSARLYRRTLMRYAVLCFDMAVSIMSTAGWSRFPTLAHYVDEGYMLVHEREILEDLNKRVIQTRYWMPITWAALLARKARREGLIRDDISLNTVILYLNKFRAACRMMLDYDWVNVPIVYTQVVTLAVYLYFMATLVGKQLVVLKGEEDPIDLYFPLFNFLEFFFYFGWLKVAECLINPFGDDDDDFEINFFIDRFGEIPMMIVDSMAGDHPALMKDQYWDECFPLELPYTEAAAKYKVEGQVGSTNTVDVKPRDAEFVRPTDLVDDNRSLRGSLLDGRGSQAGMSRMSVEGVAAARRSAANIAQKWKKLSGSSAGTGADNRSSVQERSEPETPQQPFHEMELFEREDVYYDATKDNDDD